MSETVGAALRAAREQRRLTLAEVSESTKVRVHYLQALEKDDISAMPSAAQARGFLRLYVDFLGLDLESLIPPPAAVVPELPAESAEAAKEPTGAQPKPMLLQFLTGLRARIASRLPGRTSADVEPTVEAGSDAAAHPKVPPEPAQPQELVADKKKLSQ
jgi:cytoskeletal protein RodZ